MKNIFSQTKIALVFASLLLVACDHSIDSGPNTDIRTEEDLLNVQSKYDESSSISADADFVEVSTSGLSDTEMQGIQDTYDAGDAP